MSAVSQQLEYFPAIGPAASSSPDGRSGEEGRYAETTFATASEAMGQPGFRIDPNLVSVGRSDVWLVVVTGTETYEDVAGYVFSAGQVVPSGNTVEFAFDRDGDLLMTSATAGSGPASVLSSAGIRFAASPSKLSVPFSSAGGLTSLVRQGRVGLRSCAATTTGMNLTATALAITQQQWVVFNLTVKNGSDHACRFVGSPSQGGILGQQGTGPGGAIPIQVLSTAGALVWPVGGYMCPYMQADTLRPGHTMEVRGDWYGGLEPPGHYTIVVAQAFAFDVTVE